jgi:hypothetical protein
MNQTNLQSDIRIEDLPKGIWRDFALKNGIESLLDLVERFGGSMIYVPSSSSILRESRNRAIREGTISSNLSKRQIERICRN